MGKKKSAPSGGESGAGHSKRARTQKQEPASAQQPGIAAALAAHGQRQRVTLPVLEQPRPRDALERRLTEDLSTKGEKYMEAWSEKCYSAPRDSGKGKPSAKRLSVVRTSAADEKEDLDKAGLTFLELFRQLQQQAFQHNAQFDQRTLEVLVVILRSDVLHTLGDVSYQAYSLLQGYLSRFPYATLGWHKEGEWAGRPFVVVDEGAAWEPLAASSNARGLTRKYICEEAIKDAGHNYWLDHRSGASLVGAQRRKEGALKSALELLRLCLDRAVDSVEQDHNGDVLLLRYLLGLLRQDLRARLAVFNAYADKGNTDVQRRRMSVLQNSLLWRIWADETETEKTRQEVVRLMMQLIVGVASEAELQEVEEEQDLADAEDAEPAAPCICTPRELAAQAACLLNMLLDLFGAAEAAGGFQSTSANRMHRSNLRLQLDKAMKETFWKNASEAVCRTDDKSRAFLAALAPAHRLRLLSLVAYQHVGKAYYLEECTQRPAVARAKRLDELVKTADSGEFEAAFDADPVVAMQCLNQDKSRSIKVFTNVSGDTAINNLSVVCCGIALAAQALLTEGRQLCAGGDGGARRLTELRQQAQEFLLFLADRHKEYVCSEKKERALELSRASLLDLLHAQAAISALR